MCKTCYSIVNSFFYHWIFSYLRSRLSRANSQPTFLDFDSTFKSERDGYVHACSLCKALHSRLELDALLDKVLVVFEKAARLVVQTGHVQQVLMKHGSKCGLCGLMKCTHQHRQFLRSNVSRTEQLNYEWPSPNKPRLQDVTTTYGFV